MAKLPRIIICSLPDLERLENQKFHYQISLVDPGVNVPRPRQIPPNRHLIRHFLDLDICRDENDEASAPSKEDVAALIQFGRQILRAQQASPDPLRVLVHCHAGMSRSPAAAYILLCDWLGKGSEENVALKIKQARPFALPNRRMIRFADELLQRGGKMLLPLYLFQ